MNDVAAAPSDGLPPDLLHGAARIGAAIGKSKGTVYKLADAGRLPVWRLGGMLCATRSGLAAWAAEQGTPRKAGRPKGTAP